jgi:hypothetical protein
LVNTVMSDGLTMLTDDQIVAIAQAHVANAYPPECEILGREAMLEPDGILFVANRPTPDPLEQIIGVGPFFVSRLTGEVCPFGSSHYVREGIAYWLHRYHEGWRPGFYMLSIDNVVDQRRLGQLLYRAGVARHDRQMAGGSIFRWALYEDRDDFCQHVTDRARFVLAAETYDALRNELTDQCVAQRHLTYLGKSNNVGLSRADFLNNAEAAEPVDLTGGHGWIYVPSPLEIRAPNGSA